MRLTATIPNYCMAVQPLSRIPVLWNDSLLNNRLKCGVVFRLLAC